jgi:integrase
MAAIQKRGKKYRVRIIRKGFPTQTKTFSTHIEALRWTRDIESQIDKGMLKPSHAQSKRVLAKDTLFRDAAHYYMKTHSIHKKIVRSETYRLEILIKRWVGLTVEQINKPMILELRDSLVKLGRSGDTVNHYFNTISKLFQMLQGDWDMNIPNPIKGIQRMPPSQGRNRRVTGCIEEILVKACDTYQLSLLQSIIKFAIQTGMRRGEIMGLIWTDIDLPNRRAYLHTSKNGEPRLVPLTRQAMAVLEALSRDDEKVFPMSMTCLRSQFERIKEHAKLKWDGKGSNPFEDLRFHDLRHEALSRLSDIGLNVIELSYISGHKTLGMLKRYTHPSHEAILKKIN